MGRHRPSRPPRRRGAATLTAFLDTNVLIRHLTGDPPETARVAELMRSAIAFPSIETVATSVLLRALEVYECDRIDFAEAHLVAQAEATGVLEVLSFDRSIDRIKTVTRREP